MTYDFDLNLKSTNNVFDNQIHFIKVSNNGKMIALSDSRKFIYVVDVETKVICIQNFVYHNSKIFDLSWNEDDSLLFSCSLDRSAIVWNIEKKEKMVQYHNVDKEICYSITWVKGNTFAVGGAMATVAKYHF